MPFGGMTSQWAAQGKAPVPPCGIMTRPASPAIEAVPDRMPVVLHASAHAAWLDPKLGEAAEIGKLLQTTALEQVRCYPVRLLVNSSKLDRPELIEPPS